MIGDYLNQSVWHEARTGVDGYGQPTFGAATEMRGRWLEKRRLVRNAEGEQVISEVTVTLPADASVSPGDRLSADGSAYLDVIAVSVSRDLAGEAVAVRAYL